MVIQGIKTLIERLLARRAEITLTAVWSKAHVYECSDDRGADPPSFDAQPRWEHQWQNTVSSAFGAVA